MDERYAAIDIAGKGLIIFSAYVYSLTPSDQRRGELPVVLVT